MEDFEKIEYEIFKIKYDIRYNRVLFYGGARLNARNFLSVEQAFKLVELAFYKVYNKVATRVVENSIFRINRLFINGVTLFTVLVKPNSALLVKKLSTIHPQVALMSVSLCKKAYSILQLGLVNTRSYIKNIIIFNRMLKISLKLFYVKVLFSK